MPSRRDPHDAPSSRRQPHATSSQQPAPPPTRTLPYALGGSFASSSSSLVHLRQHGSSQDLLGGLVPSTSAGGAESSAMLPTVFVGTDAQSAAQLQAEGSLAPAELHHGRVTLTAPDNMRRKKREEREAREKAKRKKAERAVQAANALSSTTALSGLPGPSHTTIATTTTMNAASAPGASTTKRAKKRTRPALAVTASDRGPSRPRSAQQLATPSSNAPAAIDDRPSTSSAARNTSPTRRRRRDRQEQQSRPAGTPIRPQSAGPTLASSTENAREQVSADGGNPSLASLAARRRHDIYAELSSLDLPGAEDSELEPEYEPPPFPANATRPRSPPRQPVEGEEWTEEDQRRQEDAIMYQVPDSPPPAFRSEDEDETRSRAHIARQAAAHAHVMTRDDSDEDRGSVSSADETEMEPYRRAWEDDLAAGFTLEERLERDRLRREQQQQQEVEQQAPLAVPQLGRLVMEARARRNADAAQAATQTSERQGSTPSLAENVSSQSVSTAVPQAQEVVASSGIKAQPSTAAIKARPANVDAEAKKRVRTAAIGTGAGLVQGIGSAESHGLQPTKVRGRPSSESHSRFRDDASAAAARRRNLWGPLVNAPSTSVSGISSSTVEAAPNFNPGLSVEPGNALTDSEVLLPSQSHLPLGSRRSSDSEPAVRREDSDSSDEAWEKEEAMIEAMRQQRTATMRASHSSLSSSDDRDRRPSVPGGWVSHTPAQRHRPRPPVQSRSSLSELGKVGESVPKAPPPLVLGRSRGGGAAYSSSSEESESIEEGRYRHDDDSDDSLSPSEPDHALSEPGSVVSSGRGSTSQLSLGSTSSHSIPLKGKGKEPVRPSSSSSATIASAEARAGQFEEDSGSSGDVSSDGDETFPQATTALDRPAVGNRLKGLFATPLNGQEVAPRKPSSSSRKSSFDRLLETQLDGAPRSSAESYRTTSSRNVDNVISGEGRAEQEVTRRPSQEGIRARSGSSLSAGIQSHARPMDEAKARSEALASIAKLQASSSGPYGNDSLSALERLLSVRQSGQDSESLETPRLGRSGAINRRSTAFVNPRSSVAPRPLGRLPTITAATRHFPPSRQPTEEASLATAASPPLPGNGTPSWMAYITPEERNALPQPLEPTKRHASTTASNSLPEPPLPWRKPGSRVSAMVERFEVNGPDARPPSPTKDAGFASPQQGSQPSFTTTSADRQGTLRRRPPPPPPPPPMSRAQASEAQMTTMRPHIPPNVSPPILRRVGTSDSLTEGARTSGDVVKPIVPFPSSRPLPNANNYTHPSVYESVTRAPDHAARPAPSTASALSLTRSPPSPPPKVQSGPSQTTPQLPPRSNLLRRDDHQPHTERSHTPIEELRRISSPSVLSNNGTGQEQPEPIRRVRAGASRPLPTPPPVPQGIQVRPSALVAIASVGHGPQPPDPAAVNESTAPSPPSVVNNASVATSTGPSGMAEGTPVGVASTLTRAPSLGLTDLDVFASRLADLQDRRQRGAQATNSGSSGDQTGAGDGQGDAERSSEAGDSSSARRDTYDDLHLLAEFLGPAKNPGLTSDQLSQIPVAPVECVRRREVKDKKTGAVLKTKLRLEVAGVKVERCGVCLVQFREGQLAAILECLHVFHEECAGKWLRGSRVCPTCRATVAEGEEVGGEA